MMRLLKIVTKKKSFNKGKVSPGPKPDQLVIGGDWRDAMGKAIKKKRPKEGWPETQKDEKENKS